MPSGRPAAGALERSSAPAARAPCLSRSGRCWWPRSAAGSGTERWIRSPVTRRRSGWISGWRICASDSLPARRGPGCGRPWARWACSGTSAGRLTRRCRHLSRAAAPQPAAPAPGPSIGSSAPALAAPPAPMIAGPAFSAPLLAEPAEHVGPAEAAEIAALEAERRGREEAQENGLAASGAAGHQGRPGRALRYLESRPWRVRWLPGRRGWVPSGRPCSISCGPSRLSPARSGSS